VSRPSDFFVWLAEAAADKHLLVQMMHGQLRLHGAATFFHNSIVAELITAATSRKFDEWSIVPDPTVGCGLYADLMRDL
jgi:hypothetical protein